MGKSNESFNRAREQELEALKKQYIDEQVADALYWERRRASAVAGGGVIAAVVNVGLLAYSLAAPSKESFQDKVAAGVLDQPKVRREFERKFNDFINDLSDEERVAVTRSRLPIAQAISTYYVRKELINACGDDIARYQAAVNKDNDELSSQKLAATRALQQAAIAHPKVVTDSSQVTAFQDTVATHTKVLEKNRDPASKALKVAGCVALLLVPQLAVIVLLGVALYAATQDFSKAAQKYAPVASTIDNPSQLWRPRSALVLDQASKLADSTKNKLKK